MTGKEDHHKTNAASLIDVELYIYILLCFTINRQYLTWAEKLFTNCRTKGGIVEWAGNGMFHSKTRREVDETARVEAPRKATAVLYLHQNWFCSFIISTGLLNMRSSSGTLLHPKVICDLQPTCTGEQRKTPHSLVSYQHQGLSYVIRKFKSNWPGTTFDSFIDTKKEGEKEGLFFSRERKRKSGVKDIEKNFRNFDRKTKESVMEWSNVDQRAKRHVFLWARRIDLSNFKTFWMERETKEERNQEYFRVNRNTVGSKTVKPLDDRQISQNKCCLWAFLVQSVYILSHCKSNIFLS